MKLSFIKTHKYCCYQCDCQFNWNNDSRWYGKLEYKTVTEKEKDMKFFCSKRCAEQFKPKDK